MTSAVVVTSWAIADATTTGTRATLADGKSGPGLSTRTSVTTLILPLLSVVTLAMARLLLAGLFEVLQYHVPSGCKYR